MENEGILHHFNQFKLLTPDVIKKCQRINNEEKNGQTIFLDKYNSRDCSSLINIIKNLKAISSINMEENKNLYSNLNIFFEKNNHVKEAHNVTLAILNSKLNKK